MDKHPLVSIIIPCYNREKYVSDAVDSALRQTYRHIEVIVVDDGSSDDSAAVLKKYGLRIQLIRQRNKGVNAARNAGLSVCKGRYVVFLDSDDWLSDDIVEHHIAAAKRWPNVDIFCADSVSMGKSGASPHHVECNWPATPASPLELFLLRAPPFPACEMYRVETVRRHGGYDESFRAFADSDLRLRILLAGGSVVRTTGGHATYRPVENSITRNHPVRLHLFARKLITKLSRLEPSMDAPIHALLKERLLRHRMRWWFSTFAYHQSLKPKSVLKFAWHLLRIMKADPGYLVFILKDKPWKQDKSRTF